MTPAAAALVALDSGVPFTDVRDLYGSRPARLAKDAASWRHTVAYLSSLGLPPHGVPPLVLSVLAETAPTPNGPR